MVKKKRIPKNPLLKFGLTTICIEEVNSKKCNNKEQYGNYDNIERYGFH